MIYENRPHFKRELLPRPIDYFARFFEKLSPNRKFSSVKCPFHGDCNPSLSLNLVTGSFKCFGCGANGNDIVDFHRLKYGTGFVETVRELGAWE